MTAANTSIEKQPLFIKIMKHERAVVKNVGISSTDLHDLYSQRQMIRIATCRVKCVLFDAPYFTVKLYQPGKFQDPFTGTLIAIICTMIYLKM